MTGSSPFRPRFFCLAIAFLALSACTDLPTGSESFQLEADGTLWTAIQPPPNLPTAVSWLTFSTEQSGGPLGAEVEALEAEAMRAGALGDTEREERLREEAARLAIDGMETQPGPGVFLTGMASLESWERNVGEQQAVIAGVPELAEALAAVERERTAAGESLRAGDRAAAALHLTRAADRVRAWGPQQVVLRALTRVEEQLAQSERSPVQMERTRHLLQSAREELIVGDPLRAVQRALYALQLAGGNGLNDAGEQEDSRCGEYSC